MKEYLISLDISADEYLRYYKGQAVAVIARDRSGRRIRFPATALRPFVNHTGVRGQFRLVTDDKHRLQRLEKLS